MSVLHISALAAALVLGGGTAAAQPPELPARLAPETRAAVARLADSLRIAGVPADPIYAKAAEGVLKGADDARILVAVRVLARELGEARATLGPGVTTAELVAAASALHAGVPAATLARLHATPRRGGLALSFVVLADLTGRGVPPAAAASAVGTLLQRGAADQELVAFRTGVEHDLLAGRSAEAAMQARAAGVLQTLDARRRAPPPPAPRAVPP